MKKILALLVMLVWLIPSTVTSKTIISTDSAKEISITIYNDNTAFISEAYLLRLSRKKGEIQINGLPDGIASSSINILAPESVEITEQSFYPSNFSKEEVLQRYINREIKLVLWDRNNLKKIYQRARLLGSRGQYYFEINGEIYLNHPGTIVLPKIPGGVYENGRLRLKYRTDKARKIVLRIGYDLIGLNWSSTCMLTLLNEELAYLKCLATIQNNTDRAFKNASLRLVAGKLHRASQQPERVFALAVKEKSAAPTERPLYEYHEYRINRPVTLKERETKTLLLFEANNIRVEKSYIIKNNLFYPSAYNSSANLPVKVILKIKNRPDNNLGYVFPAGKVRVYSLRSDASMVFSGSDTIDHTPRGEEILITTGWAFDIKARRRQVDYIRIGPNTFEGTYEITITNHKSRDIKVKVIETLQGQWSIIESSHAYKKIDATHIEFNPLVPARETVKIVYKIRTKL
ncbi:MAG: hypothetical protein GXO99_02135 [Nitrospirae bacterium]|nr:hypothetical protein [Nitrospirota bacterium]